MKINQEYYNSKISARANACIRERRAVVRIQKCVLTVLFILCISLFTFLNNDISMIEYLWNI